jgi:septal ring factor EnvC (AmiA/AmiB activator)
MTTAWEMRNETAPLYGLQRRDALRQLGQHTPGTAISLRPQRSGLIISGIVVVALALLVLLPNPMTAVLQQHAAFQARIAKQIAAIEHLRTSLVHQTNTPAQQRAQIDQILRDLETKLQNAHNETEAQQAIAEAQARLNQLRDPQANNQAQAHANASSSLASSSNTGLSALGQALATNDSKRLSNALQSLASQVSHMTQTQRAQLAQQIENAANQASQNPQLRAALHQLAKAIADGSPGEIADATRALEIAASQDATAQAQANSIDQTTQSLQQVADTLASATDDTNSQAQNQNQGQGQNGQAQGQQGQGQGQQGQGQSQGSGSGNGGKGNHTGNKPGQNEQVFVPGQIGSGSSTQSNDGNNSVVQNGSSVPYSQVIEQYNQMAHDAIDNSDISPDLKDLVHGYFNTLEGH